MSFITPLRMEHIERTVRYRLTSILTYITWEGLRRDMPIDFDSDGHTIPWPLRSVAGSPFATKTPRPAFYHDYLLKYFVRKGLMTQFEATSEYSHAMADDGANAFVRKVYWLGARTGDYWYNFKHWLRGTYEYTKDTDDIVH